MSYSMTDTVCNNIKGFTSALGCVASRRFAVTSEADDVRPTEWMAQRMPGYKWRSSVKHIRESSIIKIPENAVTHPVYWWHGYVHQQDGTLHDVALALSDSVGANCKVAFCTKRACVEKHAGELLQP
eukprot:Polyplicarium_translucidae@DN3050_c0_g2_i11.p4